MDLSRITGINGAHLERGEAAVDEPGWVGLLLTLPPQHPLHLSVPAKDANTIIASHILNVLATHDPQFQRWQDRKASNKKWCARRDEIAFQIRSGVEAVMESAVIHLEVVAG